MGMAHVGRFNIDLLKEWVAPEIDIRPEENISDLNDEFEHAQHWFQQYFLSSVFNGAFTGETRLYATNIIYRVQLTFEAYHLSRNKTLEYAENWKIGAPGINRYLAMVSAWEAVFLNLQHIYDLLKNFFEMTMSAGSREKRTWQIANRIKHGAEDISQGKIAAPAIPMWITKDGFATHNTSVTFEELSDQVRILAKIADALSKPSEAKARFEALDRELAGNPNYEVG